MKTTKQKALDWWNKQPRYKRDDMALEYYGCILILDDEIEAIYLKEVPQEIIYTEKEIRTLCKEAFDLGMEFRLKRLNGNDKIKVDGVLNDFLLNFFAAKTNKK